MSGGLFAAKTVSPVKCNEKPWDQWVSEIGHASPQRDEGADVDGKGAASGRRAPEAHPYKVVDRGHGRYRRAGLNRLRSEAMSLHGLFPTMDNLNAAVCHMCGVTVKCSAAYRHLLEYHTSTEPIRPPPPPAPSVKPKPVQSRSRHKKELVPPPPPIDILPVKMETSPIHTATAPLSRIAMPQPELQYLDEAGTSSGVTAEVKFCVESGELPVVSIQDTEDLPLGENITDDIFAIMNSEGIQTADDITNSADWKNIIRDIGNMQDPYFTQPPEPVQSQELYTPVDPAALSAYTIAETELSSLQFAANTSPMLATVLDASALAAPALKPTTPSTKSQSRSKSSKSKFMMREYDPNKHCGVVTADNPKPCTRSLTCKAHALSLRRQVEGRCKPFDTLLQEHRAAKDASAAPPPPATLPITIPPALLVNNQIDLSAFNGLTAEQQVNDIYASLLSVENAVLPDTSSITSLLSQPLPADSFLMPDEAEVPPDVPLLSIVEEKPIKVEEKIDEGPPPLIPSDVCWYTSCPRPLALCTYNASHAGGAITLGKKFATVRSNIKSSLSRSQCKNTAGTSNSYFFGQNALSLSKTVHMNSASKSNKPEVRKLVVTCSDTSGANTKDVQRFGGLFGGERFNGHLDRRRTSGSMKSSKRAPPTVLDLGFSLDPLLADEKC